MLSESKNHLLELIGRSIFKMEYDQNVSEAVVKDAKNQKVQLLVYGDNAELAHNLKLVSVSKDLCAQLKENGIPFSLLGCLASSCYYPEPVLRLLDKVSFLVSAGDMLKVDELLSDRGYILENSFDSLLYRYSKEGMIFEFRSAFDCVPDNEKGVFCAYYLRDVLDKAEYHNGQMVPSEFHHGLIILLELAKKISTSKTTLADLCDWAVFVGKVNFEKLYGTILKEIGLYRLACLLTQCSYKIGLHKQLFIKDEDMSLTDEMIEEIFKTEDQFTEDKKTSGFRFCNRQKVKAEKEIRLPDFYNDLKLFQ